MSSRLYSQGFIYHLVESDLSVYDVPVGFVADVRQVIFSNPVNDFEAVLELAVTVGGPAMVIADYGGGDSRHFYAAELRAIAPGGGQLQVGFTDPTNTQCYVGGYLFTDTSA